MAKSHSFLCILVRLDFPQDKLQGLLHINLGLELAHGQLNSFFLRCLEQKVKARNYDTVKKN